MKKSASITSLVGVLMFITGIVLGAVYIITGNSIKNSGTNYFVGHLFNSDGTINQSKAPEILAYISMITAVFGFLFLAIGMIIANKGKTKAEKKEFEKKNFTVLMIGMAIGVIAALALMFIAPKSGVSSSFSDKFTSMTWLYIILFVQFASIVVVISGAWKAYINLKKPIIDSNHKEQVNEDEF